MAFLPLDTVKLFVDLFDAIYLRDHKVKKINFNPNGMQKIYVIDNDLILLVSIVKNKSTMALNEKELFKKAHGRGNRFVKVPSELEIYYQLEIEELTPNTIGFEFVRAEYIDRLEMLTGLYYLNLDVDYIRFKGWKRPDWNPDQELTVERVNRLKPELKLSERFENWKGQPYHFAIIKLPRRGRAEYAVAYFTSDPNDYLRRFVERYKKSGTISSEIRGGCGFMNGHRVFTKLKRQNNLSKMAVLVQNRYFREKDDVWRYADKLLLKARKGDFNGYNPLLESFVCKPEPELEIDLDRFISAQDFGYFDKNGKIKETNYTRALKELKKGRKNTHWMWFIFPQLKGLGWSELSNKYGIRNIHEAIAYYEHPILGKRLEETTRVVLKSKSTDAEIIFGEVDALKFHSCLTLFLEANPNDKILLKALDKFFNGYKDKETLKLLQQANPDSNYKPLE